MGIGDMASGILEWGRSARPVTRKRRCETLPVKDTAAANRRIRRDGKAVSRLTLRAKLNRQHKLLIALAAVATMGLLLAVGVWAYDDAQKDQIAPGISIGGVDVGGRDTDSARKIIKREVVAPLQQPVVVSFGGEDYTLSPSKLRASADIDGMVQDAIDRSRDGTILDRVTRYASGGEVDADLEPRVDYDKKAVKDFVNQLAEEINQDPVDATVVPSGDKLRKQAGEAGRSLEKREMTDAINEAAQSAGRDQPVPALVKTTKPEITTKELAQAYPRYIYIDRGSFTLRYYRNLKLANSYTIAVGQAGYDTPSGTYPLQSKEVNPTWHVPLSDWAGELAGQHIPPGPGNPLVARWMGIIDGAGIHGTNETGSLGSAASHGCIRMAVPDVIELFDKVEVGDPVYIQ
jgi:lipoprotein-anchoring transpeptidase ErfK/SrfK